MQPITIIRPRYYLSFEFYFYGNHGNFHIFIPIESNNEIGADHAYMGTGLVEVEA